MKRLNSQQIEFILGQIKSLELQYPGSSVYFDIGENRVIIEYPLPKDFYKIKAVLNL